MWSSCVPAPVGHSTNASEPGTETYLVYSQRYSLHRTCEYVFKSILHTPPSAPPHTPQQYVKIAGSIMYVAAYVRLTYNSLTLLEECI